MASDTLRGIIERITYHNEENGYTIARIKVAGGVRVGNLFFSTGLTWLSIPASRATSLAASSRSTCSSARWAFAFASDITTVAAAPVLGSGQVTGAGRAHGAFRVADRVPAVQPA